ncbi:hypothetical protein FACS1894205_1160 [Alphaproteobacteria bacterium]|nr:hypothetical protein FACS1894205_1160 [Alphaproteobacteria bacterium]
MSPLVSIVVPCRNGGHTLPRLFDSILRQSLKEVEVIVVDDASDVGYAEVIEAYRAKGLPLIFAPSPTRLYTKNARMAGVRKANADIIAFADADDMLWGTTALEENVGLFRRHAADVVQFRSVYTDAEGNFTGFRSWGDPLAPQLSGREVFSSYARHGARGHTLWDKLYSKALWLDIIDTAEASRVLRYPEDAYLDSLYRFHARSYIGSEEIGYGYYMVEKRARDSAEASVCYHILLQELLPYFVEHGCSPEDLALFTESMEGFLQLHAGRLSMVCCQNDEIDLAPCAEAIALFGKKELIKALLTGARLNAERVRACVHALVGR